VKVIWTERAADDLAEMVEYIRQDSFDIARLAAKEVFDTLMSLRSLPYRGRKREEDSSREIVFARLSYVAVYEVIGERIYIKGIRHTSREPGTTL
jgi:toxin ParE1/3/4